MSDSTPSTKTSATEGSGNFISRFMARWFAKRAPRQDQLKLNLRNVYIFFSREGLLFALLLIITFIAGINYANNLVLGLCFYLASVWVISFHLTFAHVIGLQVELMEVSLAEAGKPVWARIKLKNYNSKPRRQLSLQFEQNDPLIDMLPSNSEDTQQKQQRIAKLDKECIITLPLYTQKRGQLSLPRLIISSVYPLGIMRAWSYVYFATPAWVYPKPLEVDWQKQNVLASDEETTLSRHSIHGQNDFEQLQDYIEGESLGKISWAHVASGQGMLSKHFADPVGQEVKLDYADMPATGHEQKLAQLTYLVLQLQKQHLPFQLVLPDQTCAQAAIGQGDTFIHECLLRLAKVPPAFAASERTIKQM